jgi:hypothetical protein
MMKVIDPRKVLPDRPAPPNYSNNPLLEHFAQPTNGFGFSNFRVTPSLPDTMSKTYNSRSTTDFQFEDMNQYTNPMNDYTHNRHSNFLFREHYGDYKMIDQQKVPDDYIYLDVIKNFQERNPLMDFFFSKKNLDHIQALIINMVKAQSGGQYNISRQSDGELLTIMRSIYITTPSNPFATGKDFKLEICKLNKNILDWAVPKIIVNIQQNLGYIRDQGNNVYPMDRPEFMSSAGTRINKGFDTNFI